MVRHSPSAQANRRGWLLLAIVGGSLLATGVCGCSRSVPEAGGANTPRAKESRKQAEQYALDAVRGVVAAEVEVHPEMKKKGLLSRLFPSHTPSAAAPAPKNAPTGATSPPKEPVAVVPGNAPPGLPSPVLLTPVPPRLTAAPRPTPAPRPSRTSRRPSGAVVIHERVVSEIPYPTETEAEAETLKQAAKVIADKLHELDPPLDYQPSAAVVRNDYIRPESRMVRPPTEREKELIKNSGYHPDRLYVEYDVEMTADQVRELRIQDRVGSTLRLFGVVIAVAMAGFLFLRLDEWSKGYLTSWLAVIAVALVGGAGVAMLLV